MISQDIVGRITIRFCRALNHKWAKTIGRDEIWNWETARRAINAVDSQRAPRVEGDAVVYDTFASSTQFRFSPREVRVTFFDRRQDSGPVGLVEAIVDADDYMGMLATVMNGLALQDALERAGQQSRVMTAIEMPKIAEPYIRRRAQRHLEKGRVVILAGGTGNPFFTTDTAAALRAAEIDAQAILKGTHSGVDGVYTADPKLDKSAVRYDQISHIEVITKGLKVMDATAITFCMDKNLPIVVFDLLDKGNVKSILRGEPVGTLVG